LNKEPPQQLLVQFLVVIISIKMNKFHGIFLLLLAAVVIISVSSSPPPSTTITPPHRPRFSILSSDEDSDTTTALQSPASTSSLHNKVVNCYFSLSDLCSCTSDNNTVDDDDKKFVSKRVEIQFGGPPAEHILIGIVPANKAHFTLMMSSAANENLNLKIVGSDGTEFRNRRRETQGQQQHLYHSDDDHRRQAQQEMRDDHWSHNRMTIDMMNCCGDKCEFKKSINPHYHNNPYMLLGNQQTAAAAADDDGAAADGAATSSSSVRKDDHLSAVSPSHLSYFLLLQKYRKNTKYCVWISVVGFPLLCTPPPSLSV
jgi:hypothetical protein